MDGRNYMADPTGCIVIFIIYAIVAIACHIWKDILVPWWQSAVGPKLDAIGNKIELLKGWLEQPKVHDVILTLIGLTAVLVVVLAATFIVIWIIRLIRRMRG